MTIGEKIKLKRERLGYSQKELAQMVNMTNTTMSYIEQGQACNVQTLMKICDVLGLRIELVDIDIERKDYIIDAETLDHDINNCCIQLDSVKKTLQKLTK